GASAGADPAALAFSAAGHHRDRRKRERRSTTPQRLVVATLRRRLITGALRAVEYDLVAKLLPAPDKIRGGPFLGRTPMKSRWVETNAAEVVARGAEAGITRDLALRIYTTQLLGSDPKLVLHGGGNTSLKTRARDLLGREAEVLRIKASGADMATIEAGGLPAVRLAPLRDLRALETVADEKLLAIERANLIDPAAPNPSVEVILHAFLPHTFIDH